MILLCAVLVFRFFVLQGGRGSFGGARHTPSVPIPPPKEKKITYLVDPASSHMLVSKIKPCMSKYRPIYGETADGSLNQI